jgi:RNA 2',3'-cyclic 3'-phosphodiesterase
VLPYASSRHSVSAMAKERAKGSGARLFIALDIPDSVQAEIEAWGRDALGDPALRRTSAESLHITLCFLGYRQERDVERLAEVLRGVASRAPRVELSGPVARPSHGRPALYALEVESPQAVTLQALLRESLVAEGLFEPEKHRFWPHLTVARVRPQGHGSRRPMRVSRSPPDLPQQLLQPFHGVRATLYLSKLQPQGAHYTPLAQVELSEGGRQ